MIEQERLIAAPFPGLRPFEMNENFVFFGRDGQSDEVLNKLSSAKFVAVVGTSGSGKSSLVRAGLLPALLSGHMPSAGSNWRIAVFRPGNSPIKNMALALNAGDVFGTTETSQAAERLTNIERTLRRSSLGLLEVVSQSRMDARENLLLLVDQFEELFRFKQGLANEHPEDEAAAFVKLLLEARQPGKQDEERLPIYIILTMRSDYLGHCANFWGLPEAINDGQYLIPRMTDDDRREAITGPAIIGGGRISSPLLNRLLNDAGEDPARLPILQHALMRTWDYWKSLGRLSEPIDLVHYEKIGTMTQALSIHADEAYLELSAALQKVAEKVFKALTEKEADRKVRRPATVAEIAASAEVSEDEVKLVIESFRREGRSFLMPPPSVALASDTLIDISHESLIGGWERLKKWVEEEAEAAWQYQRLAQTAALFPEKEDYLRGPALQINLKWRETNKPSKAWATRYHPGFEKAIDYLDQSKTNHENEIAERERKQKEEIEKELRHAEAIASEQKRRVKQLRLGLLVLVLLLLGMFGVTVYASYQKRNADSQKNLAEQALVRLEIEQKKTAEALVVAERERTRAEGALDAAHEAQRDAEIQRDKAREQKRLADIAFVTAKDAAIKAGEAQQIASNALEMQKRTNLALVEAEKQAADQLKRAQGLLANIKEIDSAADYFAAIMRGLHTKGLNRVAFSPNGKFVFTSDVDTGAQVWNASSGEPVNQLGHSILSTRFNLLLYTSKSSPNIANIVTTTGGVAMPLSTIPGWTPEMVTNASFSADDTLVVARNPNKTVLPISIVDVKTGKELQAVGEGSTQSFALSPDGNHIAVIAKSTAVRLWGTRTGHVDAELSHLDEVRSVAYSPNGKFVVTATKDGTASVWDAASGSLLTRLAGHGGPVNGAVFDPTSSYIVTISDKTAYLWKQKSKGSWNEVSVDSPHTVKGHGDQVTQALFSPDGKWLATTSRDRTSHLWDASVLESDYVEEPGVNLTKPIDVAVFRGHIKPVTTATFSSDSQYLATGSEDRTARVWDLRTLGAFAVDGLFVRTDPERYAGPCPVTLKIISKISVVGRNGQIKYKFVRSDRTESGPKDLYFDGPGSREVTDSIDVSRSGWVELQILEPVSMQSNRAVFTLDCDKTMNSKEGLSPAQLQEIIPNASEQDRARYLPFINAAMKEYGINTPLQQAAFLAQVAYNTVDLKILEERGSDEFLEKRYGQRKDLGNFETGDGARYKGRGGFSMVGRSNYEALGTLLGVDLGRQPQLAATPEIAFRMAAVYWYRYNLNDYADKEDLSGISRRIGGGVAGLESQMDYFKRAKRVLGP